MVLLITTKIVFVVFIFTRFICVVLHLLSIGLPSGRDEHARTIKLTLTLFFLRLSSDHYTHSLTMMCSFVRVSLSFSLVRTILMCNGIVCALVHVNCFTGLGLLLVNSGKKSNASHVFTRHLKN